MRRVNGVVAGIIICDQPAREGVSENGNCHVATPGSINMEETEIRRASIPEVPGFAVEPPASFISVNDVGRVHLVAKRLVVWFGSGGDGAAKCHDGSRNKGHGKDVTEKTAHVSQGQFERVSQENSRGLGGGADLTVA